MPGQKENDNSESLISNEIIGVYLEINTDFRGQTEDIAKIEH